MKLYLPTCLHVAMCILAVGILNVSPVGGNQMDPHVYPSYGPFFEGWYLRLIDSNKDASFGFLFGLVLPAGQHMNPAFPNITSGTDKKPLLCVSILLSPEKGSKLSSPTKCFNPKDYSILEKGKPVVNNPDDRTPPNFEAKIAGCLSFIVTPTGTSFSVSIGSHKLQGQTTKPVPWGPHGEGPESWVKNLPLPLHWFVYSLRSTVSDYSYTNTATGTAIKGGMTDRLPVIAHLEKNWGKNFPQAWVWAEGVNPDTGVSFALSSGLLEVIVVPLPAELSGYRNPAKGLACSFHPLNSVHKLKHDGCAGTATLDVESTDCHLVVELSAPPNTFSSCLVTPQADGFETGCYESYNAVAKITVRKTSAGIIDHQTVPLSALEFGGKYMCNSRCP